MDKRTQKIGLLTISIFFVLAFSLCVFPNSDESVTTIEVTEPTIEKQHEIAVTNINEPILENPHAGDMLYAKARDYQISVNITMTIPNTAVGIDFVKLGLSNDARTEPFQWVLVFNENTKAMYIESGSSVITLVSHNYWQGIYTIDLLFTIEVDWDHENWDNTDTYVLVDYESLSDQSDYFETDWSFETNIWYGIMYLPEVISDDAGTVDRGDVGEEFTVYGRVYYEGTLSVLPPSSAIDIWVNAAHGQWSGDMNHLALFYISCTASDTPGTDTYYVKVVDEGAGSGGTDLYSSPTESVSYTADRIRVEEIVSDDDHTNINDEVNIDITLTYESDGSYVNDTFGTTAALNGVNCTYTGSGGVWTIAQTRAVAQSVLFNSVTIYDDPYGIEAVNQNGQTLTQIWDQIVVQTTVADDSRVNVNGDVEIHVTLWYGATNTFLNDNDIDVYIDDQLMDWDLPNQWFELTVNQISVGLWKYYVNTSLLVETTYGITEFDGNGLSVNVIWDRIVVDSYTITAGGPRVNLGTTVEMDVSLYYAYDGSYVTDGYVTVNGIDATWDSDGDWSFSVSQLDYSDILYDTVVANLNSHGITSVDNTNTQRIIWDEIMVTSYAVVGGDNRVNVNDYVLIDVELDYRSDSTDVTDATVTINTLSATYIGSGTWRINVTSDLVRNATYDLVTCLDNTYGLTHVNQNEQSITVIWDRLLVDIEVNIPEPLNDFTVSFTLTVTYDYDDAACTTYYIAIYRNDTLFGIFTETNKSLFQDSATDVIYSYTAYQILDEATYGITAFTTNTESVEWSSTGTTETPPTTTTSDTGTTATDDGLDDGLKITLIGGSATVLFGLIGLLFKADVIEKKKHKAGLVVVGVVLLAVGAYAIWMFL